MTDDDLIDRARRGEVQAFGELVARHRAAVLRATIAALGDREEAEDVAQEAFVAAWQGLQEYRGDASLRTWLLAIAWRRALSRRRSLRRWWKRVSLGSGPGEADASWTPEVGRAEPGAEHRVIQGELARTVATVLRGLSPKLRDPLLLAASGEYTMQEVAAMLHTPVGTVKWRIAEARRLVREKVERMQTRPATPVMPGSRR